MNIGGLHRCSLVDYPGAPAAVVFTLGCNFRCWYCHNPELVPVPGVPQPRLVAWEAVTAFLTRRRGLLQAVVFSGGEPSLQQDLAEVLAAVRTLGYRTKVDTNGSRPEVLKDVVRRRLVDFIAMDVKAPLRMYASVTGVPVDTDAIAASIRIIRNSGIAHQFRTTYGRDPGFPFDLAEVFALTGDPEHHIVQPFSIPTGKPILRDVRRTPSDLSHQSMCEEIKTQGEDRVPATPRFPADTSPEQEPAYRCRQAERDTVQHHDSRP